MTEYASSEYRFQDFTDLLNYARDNYPSIIPQINAGIEYAARTINREDGRPTRHVNRFIRPNKYNWSKSTKRLEEMNGQIAHLLRKREAEAAELVGTILQQQKTAGFAGSIKELTALLMLGATLATDGDGTTHVIF